MADILLGIVGVLPLAAILCWVICAGITSRRRGSRYNAARRGRHWMDGGGRTDGEYVGGGGNGPGDYVGSGSFW